MRAPFGSIRINLPENSLSLFIVITKMGSCRIGEGGSLVKPVGWFGGIAKRTASPK